MFLGSLSGLISAFLITFLIIPFVNFFSLSLNLVDRPDYRKQHTNNIVRLGGVGIILGIYGSIWLLLKFNFIEIDANNLLWPIFYCAPLFFFLGLIDDIKVISPFIRLILQIIISIFVWNNGIQINSLVFQLFGEIKFLELNSSISLFITIIWIAGMINAINWMDGLDGLAAGLITISITGLVIIGFLNESNESIFLLFPILGACIAFLIYNIYPAKILMGDGGSYLIGFFAATLSIYFTNTNNNLLDLDFSLFQISCLFILPISDMIIVILSRLNQGKSIFLPDRSHIHHRLIDLGFSHKDTVIIIFAISQFFVSLSILISLIDYQLILVSFSILILITTLYNKCDTSSLLNLRILPRKN
tara:strand:+ start:5192 stop:6274 length:1083 start_codon:yes stop_codon:yes gene_type:complete